MFWRVHWEDCPQFSAANASSAPWGQEETFCPRCGGRGFITRSGEFGTEEDCPRCGGKELSQLSEYPATLAARAAAN